MDDAPAISDEADPLYEPLGELEPWAVDEATWDEAVRRLEALRADDPDWGDMVDRGMRLAAAHQSAWLDGACRADPEVTLALLAGEASPETFDEADRAHVAANVEALRVAQAADVSELSIRRIHGVACRPQPTHRVWVGETLQDHIMAPGDYKHHPNHVRTAAGGWQPTAPVALVRREVAQLVETANRPGLHPAVRAGYLHDAVMHVQPFADGNGRVARALASGCLLRAASVPLLVVGDGTAGTQQAVVALVDVVAGLHERRGSSAALAAWRRRADAARALRTRLAPAVAAALDRQRRAWGADLSAASVTADEPMTIVVPLPGGGEVVERLTVDGSLVAAEEARLRHDAGASGDGLNAWLDRVVSTLALRVAAELE